MSPRRTRLTIRHNIDRSVQIAYRGQDLLTYVYAPDDAQLESRPDRTSTRCTPSAGT